MSVEQICVDQVMRATGSGNSGAESRWFLSEDGHIGVSSPLPCEEVSWKVSAFCHALASTSLAAAKTSTITSSMSTSVVR